MDPKKFVATLLLAGLTLVARAQLRAAMQPTRTVQPTQPGQPTDIAAWPKVELHLHLDCSLSYRVVHTMDPSITEAAYRRDFIAPPRCTNLADYISRADRMVALMQTRENLRLATLDVFDQLRKDHVIYAEIRFAPLKHLENGLTPDQVVEAVNEAVDEGIRKTGIQVGILLCTLRHFSAAQSMETVKLVEKFRGKHVVGLDIAGDEAGYPLVNHVAAFHYALTHGIPITAHAGEGAGPKSVWATLDSLHPSRIGHGVRSAEDTALISYLSARHILLEVCPTSNLQTNMYRDIASHPVDRLYRAGVELGINTDCRTISNTDLDKEYAQLVRVFHWTRADFLRCNLEALDHAFTTDAIKARLRDVLRRAYGPAPTTAAHHTGYSPMPNRTTE